MREAGRWYQALQHALRRPARRLGGELVPGSRSAGLSQRHLSGTAQWSWSCSGRVGVPQVFSLALHGG